MGVKSAFELCNKADIPVLSVNQVLGDDLLELVVGSVTSDNYTAGYEVGQEVAKKLGGKGKVCILTYDVAFVCRERGDGFKAAMAENEGIEVLEVFDGVCTEDAAMKKTEDWLQQYPDVTAIFGNNSNCGVGIAAAVRSAGKTDDISGCKCRWTFRGYQKHGRRGPGYHSGIPDEGTGGRGRSR